MLRMNDRLARTFNRTFNQIADYIEGELTKAGWFE